MTLCTLALGCGGKGSSGSSHDGSTGAGGSNDEDAGGDSWTNPDFCPEQAPRGADACDEAAGSCHYGDQQCACIAGEWACNQCPEKAAKPAASCEGENTVCQYTERTCICAEAQWLCLSDDCPESKPSGECPTEGAACPYQTAACACLRLDPGLPPVWMCIKNAGCPDQQPTSGSACGGLMLCEYGKVLCGCPVGLTGGEARWSCM